ncbi:MAG: adenylate/guanylate cyclase domain-containing protein [Planctomycetota bacterium]
MTEDRQSPTAYLEDRPLLSRRQARAMWIVAPLACGALGFWIAGTNAIERLEGLTIDWRFHWRGPRRPPENILIVEIDESSRRGLKQGPQRFNLREHLPTAVANLWESGALVVGLDIYLEDLTTPAIDDSLAAVMREANVVLAVSHTDGRAIRAADAFLQAGPSEGVITVYPDTGNVLRRFPPKLFLELLPQDGDITGLELVPHFPLTLAMFAVWGEDESAELKFEDGVAHLGARSARPGELIDWASIRSSDADGRAGWRTLRFEEAVRGTFTPNDVDGAIVLIGESRSIRDSFVTPLSDDLVPGVYYHANAVAHILQDRHFDSAWAVGRRGQLLTAAMAFLTGLFAWNQRRWWQHRHSTLLLMGYVLAGVALFLGGWTCLAFSLFGRNVLVPFAAPLIAMALAMASGLAAQWVMLNENARRLARRARQIEVLFGQSVSHTVLEALKQSPERIRQTQTREVSVLFCDLRNFTAQTAEMTPADVAEMLNEYFDYITEAVFQEDGFIDKFVGDEVMAVFSVPFEQADHAARAVRTAVSIKRRLAKLNHLRTTRGQPPLDCGLGIHCGPAAAGHIGSRDRSNYTVVGATVNLAARIEQFTSGGEILVSESVRRKLGEDARLKPWKRVDIRGAGRSHQLYEVEVADDV